MTCAQITPRTSQIQDPVSPCNLASVANRDLSGQDTLSLLRDYGMSGILFQVRVDRLPGNLIEGL
jgi:hypothetical protein